MQNMRMIRIGYHASHEQFDPATLLRLAVLAEEAGFHSIHSSDHLSPWNERQGESGFSLAWLGAAMQATSLPFSLVCAPGPRYHPVVLAQAFATLESMFPGRFSAALGSGEAINECPTGEPWPEKPVRNARLMASYQAIKRLLAGETVSIDGAVRLSEARVFSLPEHPPLLVGAAITKETARWMGSWADGLVTVHQSRDAMKELIEAFYEGGGVGKPLMLKVQLSYAEHYEEAERGAIEQWKTNVLDSTQLAELPTMEDFEREARNVTRDTLHESVRISSDLAQHRRWLEDDLSLGFTTLLLHNVNRRQEGFIKDFGQHVLPDLH